MMKKFFWLTACMIAMSLNALYADNFYVAGFAGANYIQDNSDLKYHYTMGYMMGGNVGYRWQCSGWRIEGEYSYRKSRIKHRRHESFSGRSVYAHQIYYAGMGNLYYDFFLPNTWLTPYVGGGCGWFQQNIRYRHRSFYDEGITTGIAWQLLAGLSYEINCMWSCNITYRMLKPCKLKFYNHGITGGVRYDF
jgi:opacity protein-like surface antigen